MARPRGDGVKVVRRKRPDGSIAEYRYARPRPETDLPNQHTMAALVAEYMASPEFRRVAPATQAFYRRHLEQIRTEWGEFAIRAVRPSDIQRVKAANQDHPAKANALLAVLSILFRFGMRRDLCPTNPAANPGRLAAPKRDQVWTVEDEARCLAAFRPALQLGFLLLLHTLQRLSDVLAMTTSQIREHDGRLYIALRQQKTGALVEVPVHARLEPALRARMAEGGASMLLVPSPTGRPWLRRNFSRAWDTDLHRDNLRLAREMLALGWTKDRVRAELAAQHRQRRDLRRTGTVRLAEAGATTPQIAAIAGWSIDYTQRIIDTYLPRRTAVALGGIEAWERADAGPQRVVRLRPR